MGVWTTALDRQPWSAAREAAVELEELGYGTIWVGEALRREAFANAALLLGATRRLVVATGIASIWARDPVTMAAGQRTLSEAFPGRFLLGVGVSHGALVSVRGHEYRRPFTAMRDYVDAMDAAPYEAPPPSAGALVRVLAALGPRMLGLAAERADGAHPYLVPVEHTALAREALGPDRLLCPEVGVVLDSDRSRARAVARTHLGAYLRLPNYAANLRRLGFPPAALDGGGSDSLVDALIACGGADQIAARVREHRAAGADHVAVQVLTEDPAQLPMPQWRRLADALLG